MSLFDKYLLSARRATNRVLFFFFKEKSVWILAEQATCHLHVHRWNHSRAYSNWKKKKESKVIFVLFLCTQTMASWRAQQKQNCVYENERRLSAFKLEFIHLLLFSLNSNKRIISSFDEKIISWFHYHEIFTIHQAKKPKWKKRILRYEFASYEITIRLSRVHDEVPGKIDKIYLLLVYSDILNSKYDSICQLLCSKVDKTLKRHISTFQVISFGSVLRACLALKIGCRRCRYERLTLIEYTQYTLHTHTILHVHIYVDVSYAAIGTTWFF